MTVDLGVRKSQLEVGIVVFEVPDQPGIGIVAIGAALTQTLFVHIVVGMAIDASVTRVTKNRGCMAGFATQCSVLTDERETAQIMVESNFFLPGNFVVTLIAFAALLFFVNVVLLVTVVTGGINFFRFGTDRVAGLADQALVRAVEREIGVCVVIKFCIFPSPDDMTVLALFAVQLVVNVIGTVTAVTVARNFVKFLRNLVFARMTIVTRWPSMLSLELVPGVPTVVKNRLVPASLLVAGRTVFAESATMHIPDRMAIDATLGRILVLLVNVASVACHTTVGRF